MNPQSNANGIDLAALAGQVLALELAVKQLMQDIDNKREFRQALLVAVNEQCKHIRAEIREPLTETTDRLLPGFPRD